MSSDLSIEARFQSLGASFLEPGAAIARKLASIRAFIFDWDGVFNAGAKGDGAASTFSEPDSMGTNLLRYAFWRNQGQIPFCAIVSGANNETAVNFAKREHFNHVYLGVLNKSAAFDEICSSQGIDGSQIAYIYDDVNDLPVARNCGLRFLVRRDASPMLQEYVAMNGLADYITATEASRYAVREICELCIGLLGIFDDVVTSRENMDSAYRSYFSTRQTLHTDCSDA